MRSKDDSTTPRRALAAANFQRRASPKKNPDTHETRTHTCLVDDCRECTSAEVEVAEETRIAFCAAACRCLSVTNDVVTTSLWRYIYRHLGPGEFTFPTRAAPPRRPSEEGGGGWPRSAAERVRASTDEEAPPPGYNGGCGFISRPLAYLALHPFLLLRSDSSGRALVGAAPCLPRSLYTVNRP